MISRGNFQFIFSLSLIVFSCEAAPGDKAKAKCKEYGKLVNVMENSPVLSLHAKTNSVSKCGIVETPLIVGGVRVIENEFPHMTAIGFKTKNPTEYSYQCGGSLVSENFVLTGKFEAPYLTLSMIGLAAHCYQDHEKYPPAVVKLGVIYIKDTGPNSQVVQIEKFISHPQNKPPEKYNDIAIIKLKSIVKFSEFVRPACVATGPTKWEKAIAIGFGKTGHDKDTGSDFLLKVLLSNVEKEKCIKTYKTYKQLTKGIVDTQFCAGETKGEKDACQGDSGGPLQIVLKEPYCMYSVIGVTSFGKFCGFANSYGVYTDVSKYLDFIESNVWP